jgi:poly-gamma-glutamate synthesis protein (capsule biosynthesis protein)
MKMPDGVKKLLLLGDVVPSVPYQFGEKLKSILKKHDLCVFNLEGAFSLEENPLFKAGRHLLLDPAYFIRFADYFHVASLANNHVMDFGEEGLKTTLEICNSLGLMTVGAGKNIHDAMAPIELSNITIMAVCENEFGAAQAHKPGVATTDNEQIIYDHIKRASRSNKFIVIFAHGGTEMMTIPPPYLRERYRLWIDYGADLIVGNHAHVAQGHEVYKDRYIFYSLGNFYFFDEAFSPYPDTSWSILLSVDIVTNEIIIMPVKATHGNIIDISDDENIIQKYKQLCKQLNSTAYIQQYSAEANKLYEKSYGRLSISSKHDAALLLHYLRCDAHRSIVETALQSIIGENVDQDQIPFLKRSSSKINRKLCAENENRQSYPNLENRTLNGNIKKNCDTPFLIVGAGSSGSTLLSVLLDKHPLIACGPEISVFNKREIYGDYSHFQKLLPKWIEYGLATDGQAEYREFFFNLDAYFLSKELLINLALKTNSLRSFFDAFFGIYLDKRNKEIWGEKTGSNAYCIREFKKLYPKARIIHIVRDGRDVVCSLLRRPNNSPYHCVSHWLFNASSAIAARKMEEYLEIKYEDLVNNPERCLRKICEHIGVEYNHSMMSADAGEYWKKNAGQNIHSSWNATPLSNHISKGSISRYQNEMDHDLEKLFWSVKLAPQAIERLGVSHNSSHELMLLFNYDHDAPDQALKVNENFYLDALRENNERILRNLKKDNRLWFPVTYIS